MSNNADWMSQFTEHERDIITNLAKREYQDMTPEEVQLYARWQAAKALADSEFEHEREQREALTAEKLALAQAQNDAAIAAINEIRDMAVAYYESTIPVQVTEGD